MQKRANSRQAKLRQTTAKRQLLVAGFASVMVVSTGCKSGMPKWNLFGSRNQPSAEMLAGQGPTTTYPAPPSESATPEAIASIAGGVASQATASLASATSPNAGPGYAQGQLAQGRPGQAVSGQGFDITNVSSRIKSATGGPNTAAAQANGFNLASARTNASGSGTKTTLPGYATPSAPTSTAQTNNSAVPAIPTGYQFGTRTTAPPQNSPGYAMPGGLPGSKSLPGSNSLPGAAALPGAASQPASTSGFSAGARPTAPTSSGSGFAMPGASAPSATTGVSPSGGFALPPSMLNAASASAASNPKPFTPKPASTTPAQTVSTGGSMPSFSTASAELSPKTSPATPPSNSYAPGSTSGSSAYPSTSGYPSTGSSGSYYR